MEKVVILGSGPAGLTAAIYAARANLKPVVVSGDQPGGQLTITSDVENYPGFKDPITGPELMEQFRAQAERFGTRFVVGQVQEVDLKQRPIRLSLENGQKIEASALIIATGASAKWIGIPSEKKFQGKGVSACATCDGFFFKGQDVAVVGGGDTAMEEANFLTRFCKSVTVIHRRDTLRASKIMQEKAFKNPKIKFKWNVEIEEILGDSAVTGVRLKNINDGNSETLNVTGVFVAIGHQPNTKIFQGQLKTDAAGYLKVETGTTKTEIPGVFAAGDVSDHVYRQAVTAAGTGCMAAIDAERWLEAQGE